MTHATTTEQAPLAAKVIDLSRNTLEARGSLSDLLRLMGREPASGRPESALPIAVRRVRRDAPLCHQGTKAESIYFVRSGTFKVIQTLEDGYDQVLGFVGPSQVLGFDALYAESHPTTAIALDEASVFVVPLFELNGLGECRALVDVIHRAASAALADQAEIAAIMSAVRAEVRLSRFLLQLSRHMAARGQSPRRFILRMDRRDIASYLAVAIETISRAFGALAESGLITFRNREVEIVDMEGLHRLAFVTRRPLELPDQAVVVRQSYCLPAAA
jgi:CRP/FNR family transcriptional regulator